MPTRPSTPSPRDDPAHVARFGSRFDAQGVLPGSKDAGRCISYLTKYLTKQIAGCHTADTADTADRLMDARRKRAVFYNALDAAATGKRRVLAPKPARLDAVKVRDR